MSFEEVAWRVKDHAQRTAWSSRQVRPGKQLTLELRCLEPRPFRVVLPAAAVRDVPAASRAAVVAAAEELLKGRADVLGVFRDDLVAPDWFLDPLTGRRASPEEYAFRINHRSEEETGNIKQVWELSRHQHLTVLSCAWYLTREDDYAERVAEHLTSWWRENPFLSGVHWTSGIEVGLRLISWTWIRRLLDGWPRVRELFDDNPLAIQQIRWHQEYLAAFRSRGSSANNHVIAEAAGQLVASCAFPWFPESQRWGSAARLLLSRELQSNTFPSGVNRELASEYHGFVGSLGALAAVEAHAAGAPLDPRTWTTLCRMMDSAAALVDETLRPPRQGDGDSGRALLLAPDDPQDWSPLLALGGRLFGPLSWWPKVSPDVTSVLVGALVPSQEAVSERPGRRPSHFADAGVTILRSPEVDGPEIWCRCDGGPHGFLSIAGHAHADALAVEVRYGGVDILADPGTYCYHGNPAWRSYFRSTLAHNTVELDGRNQSAEGGPFLWVEHAETRVLTVDVDEDDKQASWQAVHDGYLSLEAPVQHHRSVRLDRPDRSLEIRDEIEGESGHRVRMAFHLGPTVEVRLHGAEATISWPQGDRVVFATVDLPSQLAWTVHIGESDPPLGWYSPGFGRKVPAAVLVGSAGTSPAEPLMTRLRFLDSDLGSQTTVRP